MSTEADFLISNPKAAKRAGVCVRTVFRWIKQPELNFPKPIVINGRRYFSSAEIDAWLDARRNPIAPRADRVGAINASLEEAR